LQRTLDTVGCDYSLLSILLVRNISDWLIDGYVILRLHSVSGVGPPFVDEKMNSGL